MAAKQLHKHIAVTTRVIRQLNGVPYEMERRFCADCRQLLDERPVRRAAA
jgi:hypothetical protein